MTKEMFESITKWQKETFTKATAHSAAKHLEEEVSELLDQLHIGHVESTLHEYADCFLLLFGSAALYGLDYEEICGIISDKMEVNKKRKWGEINKDGYVKHVNQETTQ